MSKLARYVAPPPVEPEACRSCACMRPECITPYGDGALPMCWLCAHLVTEHEHVAGMPVFDCGCTSAQIYPADYRASFARTAPPERFVYAVHSESGQEMQLTAKYAHHDTNPTHGDPLRMSSTARAIAAVNAEHIRAHPEAYRGVATYRVAPEFVGKHSERWQSKRADLGKPQRFPGDTK